MMATIVSRTDTFTALGSTITVSTRPWEAQAVALVQEVIADVDQTCSRFRDDSDLSRVNAHPGHWVEVDPLLVAAVQVAMEASEHTDGLVSPCLGRTLRSVGYDADLDIVRRRVDTPHHPQVAPRQDAWRGIEINPHGAIRIPHDVELDLGATGKAFAADLAALTVHDELGIDVAVSAGGDVRIINQTGDLWPIEIAERPEDPVQQVVSMVDGGIATSSTTRRRWTQAGVVRHHLLDPRTGFPADGPWRTVTASGVTCVAANVAATVAIVLGDTAVEWLRDRGVWARLVDREGTVTVVGGEVAS